MAGQIGQRVALDRDHIILAGLIAGLAVGIDDEKDLAREIAGIGREPGRLAGAEPAEAAARSALNAPSDSAP